MHSSLTSSKLLERHTALRRSLALRGVTAFLVPHSDAHQNESLPACEERLAWLTGFTGSAGSALILEEEIILFVDGRYILQARLQVPSDSVTLCDLGQYSPALWIAQNLPANQRVGYDPMLHTHKEVQTLQRACLHSGSELVPLLSNPIEILWEDRPPPPSAPIVAHAHAFCGEEAPSKIARVQETLSARNVDVTLITQLDSIAWLFNLRGGDLPDVPVFLSFALIYAKGPPVLFVDASKMAPELREAVMRFGRISPLHLLDSTIKELGERKMRLLMDPARTPHAFFDLLERHSGTPVCGEDPISLLKAVKNSAERAGAFAAHLRDGVAFVRFLSWLEAQFLNPGCDEHKAAVYLLEQRAQMPGFKGPSFSSISATGSHGAIVHYRVTPATNRLLREGDLYLIDSGGQYEDGTTDVTRTLAIGTPTEIQKKHFTVVLKAHIALARARFPEKTTGAQLDGVARNALWQAGLDCPHSLGHGVGSFLSVHERPPSISKTHHGPLKSGMIVSNEPGLYFENAYGIRIENLYLVTEPAVISEGIVPMLGFEALTLAPIDLSLICKELLTGEEQDWLNTYHAHVFHKLAPLLDETSRAWLLWATRAL